MGAYERSKPSGGSLVSIAGSNETWKMDESHVAENMACMKSAELSWVFQPSLCGSGGISSETNDGAYAESIFELKQESTNTPLLVVGLRVLLVGSVEARWPDLAAHSNPSYMSVESNLVTAPDSVTCNR